MRRWSVVISLVLVVGLAGVSGCARGARLAEQTAQQAVDAVFRKVGDDATYRNYPRTIGSRQGEINVGGPSPGQVISAIFETQGNALGGGQFEVRLVMRWGPGGFSGTWTFQVNAAGVVQELGHSGDWPVQIP